MRNIKLTIEYDGTNHAGWQVQKNAKTIQEVLEDALRKILQRKVVLYSSGRTDSGVHAQAQVANFKSDTKLSCDSIVRALNSCLPEDIAIKKAQDVPLSFHSRFSAKSKLYRYTILNSKTRSPLARHFSCHIPYKLDIKAMRLAAKHIIGRRDFKSFQATDKIKRPSVRTIKNISIKKPGDFIYIDVEADGFLYRMVRNIVGTLLDAGRGKIRHNDVKAVIKTCDRTKSGPTAKPLGLCLIKVKY